jgi:hypothetical protein
MKSIGLDKTTTIYPIEGNHDTFPVDVEDFSQPYSNGPINGFKADWESFMDADQFEIFGKFGYYS